MSAPATSSISLSASAARKIAEIVAGETPGTMLRVSVEGGGCSGFQYKFDLDTRIEAGDAVLERDGARVVIDPVSQTYMSGSEIDFVDALIGASFQIRNPNATSSCGCGTSFSL